MNSQVRVHYGCGNSVGASRLNFDASPMLRVERIPNIGRVLHAAVGGGTPFPREVRYGNIADKPLVPDDTAKAVYASHISRAEVYLEQVRAGDTEAAPNFTRHSLLGQEERTRGLIRPIRRAFSSSSHMWMWDAVAMRAELERAAFTAIRECQFSDAEDPAFARLEVRTRFIDTTLQRPECAMEARKPT